MVISVTPLDKPVVSSSWFLLRIMCRCKSFCMSHIFFNSDFSEVRCLEVEYTKLKSLDIFLRFSTPIIPTLCFPKGLQETQTRQRIQMMVLRILQCGHFPGGPVVDYMFPLQGMLVRSLIRKLRFCMPCSVAKINNKLKPCEPIYRYSTV